MSLDFWRVNCSKHLNKKNYVVKKKKSSRMELLNHKNAKTYAIAQRTSSKETFLILVL
jgi:hypothetical protein